ncbi:TraI/MobA(P) family conjugative relaxase [Photobacterium damselae]
MIVEEIKSKKVTRSLNSLVDYMCDTQNDGSKVDYISISNCINDDVDLALVEMNLIQGMNTRTKLDKTMHLVVSFPDDEIPNREQMDDIEQTIAESIGMGKHHRISVAHSNTDNYHLHMAINRIDPDNQKMINPYNYHLNIMKAAAELEIKHGLQITERQPRSLEALTMDYHSGQQSLLSWCNENIKEKLNDVLNEPNSWDDIHSVFDSVGLELKKSGRGLVVYNQDNNTAVKASTVSRDLSITKLQKKIGVFKQSNNIKRDSSKYKKEQKKDPLFSKYEEFKDERSSMKDSSLDSLRDKVVRQRELAKVENALHRQRIKDNTILTPSQKFDSYKRLGAKNKKVLSLITSEYAKARKSIYNQYGNMSFQQFLCLEAANGNEEALQRLRTKANHQIVRNGLSGSSDKRITHFDKIDVDKQGTLHYQVGQNTILDNGKQLTTKTEGLQAHKQLLEMAIIKYGNDLTINGSDEFKAQIKEAAEMLNIDVNLNGDKINAQNPVSQFIDKRNQSRQRIDSIPEHKLYGNESGSFEYNGYRNIGSQSVILLKKENILFVKPIEKRELASYKSIKKGSAINLGVTSSDKKNQIEH